MKAQARASELCAWILLAVVLGEFAFVACNWLPYSPPTAAVTFAFSGAWFKEPFYRGSAGLALDQPTVGKFFLWTSIMSCLACTIVLLLHMLVDVDRRLARWCVHVSATLLVAIILIEFLVPTFLLVQYVLSMGITFRRFLGLCLCAGFWISLPAVVFWIRKANPSVTRWMSSPITWALACSLVAPTYYLSGMLHPLVWRHWATIHTVLLLLWLALVAPIPCVMLLKAWERRHSMNHEAEGTANHCTTSDLK